jgi:hypothetical protein
MSLTVLDDGYKINLSKIDNLLYYCNFGIENINKYIAKYQRHKRLIQLSANYFIVGIEKKVSGP